MNSTKVIQVIKRTITKQSTSPSIYSRSNSTASTSTLPSSSPSASSLPTSSPRPFPSSSSSSNPKGTRLYYPSSNLIQSHLKTLLAPIGIELNEELSLRSMTHKSGDTQGGNNGGKSREEGGIRKGHGEKLTFVGRRILRLHLNLFLSTSVAHSPSVLQQYLTQESTDTLLATKELGSGVGKEWGIQECMRWREVRSSNGEASGLYKTRGAAVEALVGAVHMQHGIVASSNLFKKLVLPNLVLPFTLAKTLEEGAVAKVGA